MLLKYDENVEKTLTDSDKCQQFITQLHKQLHQIHAFQFSHFAILAFQFSHPQTESKFHNQPPPLTLSHSLTHTNTLAQCLDYSILFYLNKSVI